MKFGKLPPKLNEKTLDLHKYLGGTLPSPPLSVWRENHIPPGQWGMFGNDTIGDCTCAAIAHMLMLVSSFNGPVIRPTEKAIIRAYSAVSGYDPATGTNDNGAAITDVLNYWQTNGINGHKILGWASISPTNLQELKQGIYIFGGINIGINVPQSAMDQFGSSQPWDVVKPDGGIVGGHSVPNFGYNDITSTTCITWAQRQPMSWDWLLKYCDEAYVVISPEWLSSITKVTPNGFDLASLQADLANL